MLIKLCHANNGNLIEEFSITKFEDLENTWCHSVLKNFIS